MRHGVFLFIMTLLYSEGRSDLSSAYTKGTAFSTSKQVDVVSKTSSTKTSDIPGFKGTLSDSSFDEKSLGESAANASSSHEASKYITRHARDRKHFTLNPENDPLVVNANKAIINPMKTMGEIIIEEDEKKEGEEGKEFTCLEGGEEFQSVCSRTLLVELKVTPEKVTIWPRYCPGHDHQSSENEGLENGVWRCQGCCGGEITIDRPKRVDVIREEWIDTCKELESNADKGICRYVSVEKGNKETHIINGEPVNRDSWWEKYTYACLKESGDQCSSLKARGCIQKKSQCVETQGDVCVQWKQTFVCPSVKKSRKRYKLKGDKSPFCMTGNCVDASYEANTELFDAMSHLYVLSEAQKDIRANIGVFKGQGRACRKNCVGFRDCCTTGKGWGVSMSLAECNGEEKELAEWRTKNRCVLVGTYCAEKVLGVCIRKKTSFCCFGTKLSKLIQEQGRGQLGLGWGDPKEPDCRGLSPEELSRLDFSRMDLSPLYADIQANFKPQSSEKLAKELNLDSVRTNMAQLAHKMTIPSEVSEKDKKK